MKFDAHQNRLSLTISSNMLSRNPQCRAQKHLHVIGRLKRHFALEIIILRRRRRARATSGVLCCALGGCRQKASRSLSSIKSHCVWKLLAGLTDKPCVACVGIAPSILPNHENNSAADPGIDAGGIIIWRNIVSGGM